MTEPNNDTLNLEDLKPKQVGEPAAPRPSRAVSEANEAIGGSVPQPKPALPPNPAPVAPAPPVKEPVAATPAQVSDAAPAAATLSFSEIATAAAGPHVSVAQPLVDLTPQPQAAAASAKSEDYSWIDHTLRTLGLGKIFNKHTLKYALIGLVSIGIFLLVFNFPVITANIRYHFSKTPPAPSATVTSANTAAVSADPVVVIPKLSVNVPLQFPPTLDETQIQVALRDGVVHYANTALPGQTGNVVIFGHSSNDWWEPGNYKFVFALLDRLAVGDTIQVNYQSKKYVYQVASTKTVDPTDFSVVQPTATPTLTLITCTPPGTSWKRLVVIAPQIDPPIVKTTPQVPTKIEQTATLPGDAPASTWTKITNFFQKVF